MESKVKLKLLDPNAKVPQYQTEGSAGFDLHSNEDLTILAGQTITIKTGIAIELPIGLELQIRSRSGLAAKNNIFVLNSPGTIDSDYRGEIMIILSNAGSNFTIKKGDRIAQGVITNYYKAVFEITETLQASERGVKGLGSTKIN